MTMSLAIPVGSLTWSSTFSQKIKFVLVAARMPASLLAVTSQVI